MKGQFQERLKYLFAPGSVAIAGASNDRTKWGYRILFNLIKGGYRGQIYPINPRESDVLGLPVFSHITDIPGDIDLAVITVPTQRIVHVIRDCVDKNVKCAVVITSGFSETGIEGKKLEEEIGKLASDAGMALVGPNCVGIISPPDNLFCHMMPSYPRKGYLAIVGQSGSTADMIASRISSRGMGISRLISVGNEAVLQVADYLEYLADDNETLAILLYIEGFRDGRRFIEIARKVTQKKPVLILKAGSTKTGAKAGQSHTGVLAGSDQVVDSALRQAGIIRCDSLDEMVDAGLGFINQPLPRSNRVAIVTAGGGWGVMSADVCTRSGLVVPPLDDITLKRLNRILPDFWSHNNPVDATAGARCGVVELLEIILESPNIDGIISLGAIGDVKSLWRYMEESKDQDDMRMNYARGTMEHLSWSFHQMARLIERHHKPIFMAMFMPVYLGTIMDNLQRLALETGIACYASPHQACNAYIALSRYAAYLRGTR